MSDAVQSSHFVQKVYDIDDLADPPGVHMYHSVPVTSMDVYKYMCVSESEYMKSL